MSAHRIKHGDHDHATVDEVRKCKPGYVFQGQVTERGEGRRLIRDVVHDDPCVCGPYDRCREVRTADAQWSGNWRDQFRAYND